MAHLVPLHANTRKVSEDQLVLHRQAMANKARVLDMNGGLAGFRPQYMERVLVAAGQADRSLLNKPLSARQKAKWESRKRYLKKMQGLVDGCKPSTIGAHKALRLRAA